MLLQAKLADDSLFIRPSQNPNVDPNIFTNADLLKDSSKSDLIDCTLSILKSPDLAIEDVFSIWELRLTLLMLDNQLSVAKAEAIGLNNALYLHENPTASSTPRPTHPSPRPMLSQVSSSNSVNSLKNDSHVPNFVYPLTKNIQELLGHPLQFLILRLRSVPNLSLVNELYKLCYQFRLKGTSVQEKFLQSHLISLAYEIIMVLTITRNHATLISFLNSLRNDIAIRREQEDTLQYLHFSLNISLMWIIASTHLRMKNGASLEPVLPELKQVFDELDSFTLQCIQNVLRTYTPLIGGDSKVVLSQDDEFDFKVLISLAQENKISGRIICCTLAAFELQNAYGADFIDNQQALSLPSKPISNFKFSQAHEHIMGKLAQNLNKVFAIE